MKDRRGSCTRTRQFVGGDAAEDALPVLEQLRAANKGALFVYSVEVDETETSSNSASAEAKAAHKRIVDETLHCLDVAAAFEDKHAPGHVGRGTWMAIKLVCFTLQTTPYAHPVSLHLECNGPKC